MKWGLSVARMRRMKYLTSFLLRSLTIETDDEDAKPGYEVALQWVPIDGEQVETERVTDAPYVVAETDLLALLEKLVDEIRWMRLERAREALH